MFKKDVIPKYKKNILHLLNQFIKKRLSAKSEKLMDENDHRLLELKDIHRGQRAFVIGSGPSLRVSDLDRLKNEITFACNKIYLAFDKTKWRPTYCTVIDRMVAKNNCQIIKNLKPIKIFSSTVRPYFPDSRDVIWLNDLPTPIVDGEYKYQFSKDLVRGIYGGYTVIYTILQIAFFMGIREVYLLGIDFNFKISKPTGDKTAAGEVLLKSEGEINHFHPDYRNKDEIWTMPRLDIQYKAFKASKEVFEKAGGFIANASRKTKLDVFSRADFDSIVAEVH